MAPPVLRRSADKKMSSTLESLKKVYDRVEQTVAETVGSAQKTELSQELLLKINMVDDIKTHVSTILAALERHIPHDQRLISSFSASTHSADAVAQAMHDFARSMENWPRNDKNEYIMQMFLCAEDVFKTLSKSEKVYVENAAIHFLAPMKLFLNADMKKFEFEKKNLQTARVDMDFARNKATKTENDQNVLEASRATAEFTKQRELVEEEVNNMELKMMVVRRSLGTYVNDLVVHLNTSLEAAKKLQLIMGKQLDQETAGNRGTPTPSTSSLPDPYHTEVLHAADSTDY